LQALKEKYPDLEFALIIGEDNLRSFHKWKNYEYILENYKIYTYPRLRTIQEKEAGASTHHQFEGNPNIIHVDAPIMEISSTAIRRGIKEKKDVRYLLTEPVFKYLDEMNFYK